MLGEQGDINIQSIKYMLWHSRLRKERGTSAPLRACSCRPRRWASSSAIVEARVEGMCRVVTEGGRWEMQAAGTSQHETSSARSWVSGVSSEGTTVCS